MAEIFDLGFDGAVVEGADLLAEVAAEELIGYLGFQVVGDWLVVFDCEVGNAAAGVEGVRGDDGAGGAGVDAFLAAAAVVFCRLIGREGEIQEEFAQEEV
jgi:hypothetical protein